MADEISAPNEENSSKKNKWLLLLILLLLVGGGGFFAYQNFIAKEKKEKNAANLGIEPIQKEQVGEMLELDPFVVNLADPKGKRYLKVKIIIELESLEIVEKAKKVKPKMRDMVIIMLTSLTFEEVMTPEGKIRIREELEERFNHVIRPDRVKHIYFTDFVVQ